jgi:hypothetical protein
VPVSSFQTKHTKIVTGRGRGTELDEMEEQVKVEFEGVQVERLFARELVLEEVLHPELVDAVLMIGRRCGGGSGRGITVTVAAHDQAVHEPQLELEDAHLVAADDHKQLVELLGRKIFRGEQDALLVEPLRLHIIKTDSTERHHHHAVYSGGMTDGILI